MQKKLQRNEQDKILAGVCSGLADYFDVDVTWIRIAFVVATLAGFSGVLAYIILWIAVPARPITPGNYNSASGRYNTDYRVYEEKQNPESFNTYTANVPSGTVYQPKKSGNGRMIAGLLLVAFGAFFLLDEFNVIPYWFDFDKLWPLIFIIPGILIISKNGKRPGRKEETSVEGDQAMTPTHSADLSGTTTHSSGTATTSGTMEDEPKL